MLPSGRFGSHDDRVDRVRERRPHAGALERREAGRGHAAGRGHLAPDRGRVVAPRREERGRARPCVLTASRAACAGGEARARRPRP